MDLYALPPEEFTAARDAAVKQARADKDKDLAAELGGLRRPTVSAYAVNALVRAEPDLLTQLLDLGSALAEAQRAGEGEQLKALGAQRRQLIEAVATRAVEASGRSLPAAARDEVVGTLEAALADPASADAVRTGRLVRALSYAGFGGVDLDGAVAPARETAGPGGTGTKAASGKRDQPKVDKKRKRLEAAEQRCQQAHGALDDAVRAQQRAVQVAEQAADGLQAADDEVQRAEDALAAAKEQRRTARKGQDSAYEQAESARAAVEQAQHEAEEARRALDELRRG